MGKQNLLNIPAKELVPVMEEQLKLGKTVRFFPRGTSMLPLIREGVDSVTLKQPDQPVKRYDIVFYKRDNGQYVLHRAIEVADTVTCIGDNQYDYEKGLRYDQIIAVVCEFSHGEKTISVSSLLYRIYCVTWCATRPLRHFCIRVIRKLKSILKKV